MSKPPRSGSQAECEDQGPVQVERLVQFEYEKDDLPAVVDESAQHASRHSAQQIGSRSPVISYCPVADAGGRVDQTRHEHDRARGRHQLEELEDDVGHLDPHRSIVHGELVDGRVGLTPRSIV